MPFATPLGVEGRVLANDPHESHEERNPRSLLGTVPWIKWSWGPNLGRTFKEQRPDLVSETLAVLDGGAIAGLPLVARSLDRVSFLVAVGRVRVARAGMAGLRVSGQVGLLIVRLAVKPPPCLLVVEAGQSWLLRVVRALGHCHHIHH
jgi:hypothetical protein